MSSKVVVLIAGVVVGGLLVGDQRAHADDDSDRADLIRNIDDRIKSMASELSGFDSDRDNGDLNDALSYAREVRDLVGRLDRVKGSDSRANDIVDKYPRYLDGFDAAAKFLSRMKDLQFLADGVADKCNSDEADLQTVVRYYVGRPDDADEAFKTLPDKAKEYGKTWTERLATLKQNDSDFSSVLYYARFTEDRDEWSRVSSSFNDDASRMASFWKDRYRAVTEGACPRLALGEKHPDVDKGLENLRNYTATTKGTVTQLTKDYNAWLREARQLRAFTEKDRDDLREVMCRAGEYEMEAKVKEVADRWASQISSAYGTMLGQSDRLESRATDSKIAHYKGSKRVVEGIQANRRNFEKLRSYELQGANNPKIRAKLEYGKKVHADRQSSMCSGSSGYAEFKITSTDCRNEVREGSDCRADCVLTGSSCKVIEIKPRTQDAMYEGGRQMKAYTEGLKNWYARDKASLFEKYPQVRNCERDGKELVVDPPDLDIYDFCPDAAEAKGFGDDVAEPPADAPETGE
ncbi:MAG TPA: hypothetical protein VFV99_02255 [Kofleriaceae bacterium]|nr:hypothetical protein [Kofleriaceae bacterium]